jgi:hypothetical protein
MHSARSGATIFFGRGRLAAPRVLEQHMRMSESGESMFEDDDSSEMDEEFALGDGTADSEATVSCPYCGEAVEITLDPGGGAHQDYVEDCEVCCQPWRVSVQYGLDGEAEVEVTALGE